MDTGESSTDQKFLLADQVKELYRHSYATNFSLLVITPLLGWILWPVNTQLPLLLWYFYTVGVIAFRVAATVLYNRSGGKAKSQRFWLNVYVWGIVLSGAGWGALLLLVAPLESTYYVISTVLVICGLVTGSAASLASLRYGFAAFSMPALLPGAIYLVQLERPDSFLIGIFILSFLVFISIVALRIHKAILYSLRQQFAHSRRIVELEQRNQEAENRARTLEKQLERVNRKVAKYRDMLRNKSLDVDASTRHNSLLARNNRLKVLLEKLNGGIWECNFKTGEVNISPAWLEMLGYEQGDVQPTMEFWKSLLHPDERQDVLARLNKHASGNSATYSSSHRLKNKAGDWVWVMSRGQSVAWGTYGEVLSLSSIELVISDSNDDLSSKLSMLNFDITEWFFTPAQFYEHLQHVQQTVAVEGVEHTLCHLRVFRKKTVGSKHRGEVDEALTNQLGRILLKESRHGDAIVNFGNKGYGLLIEYCSMQHAWAKAKALQNLFKSYQFTQAGNMHGVELCIGITPLLDANKSVADVLKDAELACYMARDKSPSHIYFYLKENTRLGYDFVEKQMLAQLQDAITNKGFQLAAIPVNAMSFRARNNESLFFMDSILGLDENHEALKFVDFRAVAESNNLGVQVDRCAVELFYTWAHAQNVYREEQRVYILECSASSILDESFISFLQHLGTNTGRGPSRSVICFGIPESVLASNSTEVANFIDAVKPLGYRFALTQFRSTALSHEHIHSLPFDYLIIDNGLIERLEIDKASFLTVKYINEIGHIMNLKTVVRDVASAHQLETLKRIEVDYVHGHGLPEQHATLH